MPLARPHPNNRNATHLRQTNRRNPPPSETTTPLSPAELLILSGESAEHLQTLQLLQKQHTQSQRDFTQALAALQSAEPKTSFKPAPEPPPPPRPPKPVEADVYQTIRVTVENGVTVTDVDLPAKFWLDLQRWDVRGFVRQFYFPNAHVPDEYAWALTHNGVSYEPCAYILITYSPGEFARLCQLEFDTGSVHLLDGERTDYDRHV